MGRGIISIENDYFVLSIADIFVYATEHKIGCFGLCPSTVNK